MDRILASLVLLLALVAACNQDPDPYVPRPTADLGLPPVPPESTRCSPTPATQKLRSELLFEHPWTSNVSIQDAAVAPDGNIVLAVIVAPGSVLFGQTYGDVQKLVIKLSRDGKQVLWRSPPLVPIHTGRAWVRTNGPDILFADFNIEPNRVGERVRLARLSDRDGTVLRTVVIPTGTDMDLADIAVAGLPGISSDILLFVGEYEENSINSYYTTLIRFSPTLDELSRSPRPARRTPGAYHASLSLGVDGEPVYGALSFTATPFGQVVPDGQAEVAQVKADGTPRWATRLRYGPKLQTSTPLDPLVSRNTTGGTALGTFTMVGATLGIGARSFQLDGWLWVAMLQGADVRWVRSACSGTPLLLDLHATPEGGVFVAGTIGPEGSVELGGGVRLPEVGYQAGNIFVALYGPTGDIVAAATIPGMNGWFWQILMGNAPLRRWPRTRVVPDGKDWLVFFNYSVSDPATLAVSTRAFRISISPN